MGVLRTPLPDGPTLRNHRVAPVVSSSAVTIELPPPWLATMYMPLPGALPATNSGTPSRLPVNLAPALKVASGPNFADLTAAMDSDGSTKVSRALAIFAAALENRFAGLLRQELATNAVRRSLRQCRRCWSRRRRAGARSAATT